MVKKEPGTPKSNETIVCKTMVKKEPGTPKSNETIKSYSKQKQYFAIQPNPANLSVHTDSAKIPVSNKKRKRLLDGPGELRLSTLQQAEKLQSSLDSDFPSFVKIMLPSHVAGGFWLGLPSKFCSSHLPKHDKIMTLVNESGNEYPTKYLVGKSGLSGGWRGFSILHKLVEKDVLVFHLVEATRFKVYILRAHGTPKKSLETNSKKCFTTQSQPHSLNLSGHTGCAKTTVSKTKRSTHDPAKTRLPALERAEKVRSSLNHDFPSFVKYMLPSHVTGCFWLGLPSGFCKLHLPKQDSMMTLVNENGEEYPAKYLAEKDGLSGGWRGFSMLHKLVEGDVLVFHLVEVTKFKVYIVRAGGLAEVDGALGLVGLDSRKQTYPVKIIKKTAKKLAKKHQESFPLSTHQAETQSTSNLGMPAGQTEIENEEDVLEALLKIKSSGSVGEFKDVKNLEDFTIKVEGFPLDSEIPNNIRTKYYELCCSQKAFLHEHILEGLNFKLAAGIISETVNIADAINSSKPSTSKNSFATWDKSLMAFEQMGMNVSFLRAQLQKLMNLGFELKQENDLINLGETMTEQARAEKEIQAIEAKLVELKKETHKLEAEMGILKVKAKICQVKVEPW